MEDAAAAMIRVRRLIVAVVSGDAANTCQSSRDSGLGVCAAATSFSQRRTTAFFGFGKLLGYGVSDADIIFVIAVEAADDLDSAWRLLLMQIPLPTTSY